MSDFVEPEPQHSPPMIDSGCNAKARQMGMTTAVYEQYFMLMLKAVRIPDYLWGKPIRIEKPTEQGNPDE